MADKTYQELNIGEVRAVELTIEDNDGFDFAPSAAYVEILDKEDNIVVARKAAFTQDNKAYTIVGTATTSAEGRYSLIWELLKDGYTFYHCTELEVSQVCLKDDRSNRLQRNDL
jgi:hypothetical protein